MKKMIASVLFLIMTSSSYAQDISCQILVNTEIVNESTISVEANSKMVYGDVEGYRFMINNLGASKYEIEIFDPSGPSRSYASGTLKTEDDKISWTFWSRDIMLESNCRLSGNFL